MRMKHVAAVAAAATLALGMSACGGDGDGGSGNGGGKGIVGKAQSQKKLVIGVKADQPGLGLQTGSTYEGFDIEIAKIVAKGLGVDANNIEWKTTVSANREPFIQQGTVDLVVATYTINDERKQKVNFAGPYFVAGQDLLVKADSTITGPEGLDGKKVCSVQGSTPAKRIQTDHPKAKLQQFDAYSKCITALEGGQVDAVTTDDIILAGYAAQSQYAGKFKVVGKTFSTEPYGIGLKKDDKDGCEKVNEILKAAASDGTYKAAWDATLGKSGKAAPELDTTKLTNCGSV
ncbi:MULTISPECIES: glutamate ABC transporter substrate-binding protein [Micromonospora]|jgi:glutamate transport system substrate-binding protein|uniref:Glutamate ABC transporter substrate-binding protein n=1 Tax=Micromonospora sicca TaxID=2202420 RepID=A0A317DWP9_9ACTN|nr:MULTISPECIES: glutamate ABC transporter substrate-binding protein [unclassified Micromonospora]MBM0227668.1 glutamate ABC transporter substrate-binding protein [Micromonospora sp. ATA51]MDZ5443159.1 glutamate ABC transporter substrate-binding protein [Micromonospora sp. 4G57]MDZ5488724.1 glutamate ABC transporter substrate-binding protein [Micromonospora sp. 4G53]PWR17373.1 glutamate-binding protein [Micromonospora sp. 4G51]